MDITNKTQKPLSVPLPGGRKLFLGPGQKGQVAEKALAHPPLAKLIEAGDLETSEGGTPRPQGGASKSVPLPGSRHGGAGAERHSGDR